MPKEITVRQGATRAEINAVVTEFMALRRSGRNRVPTMIVESGGRQMIFHNTAGGLRSTGDRFASELELQEELAAELSRGGSVVMGVAEYRQYAEDPNDRRRGRDRGRRARLTAETSRRSRGG